MQRSQRRRPRRGLPLPRHGDLALCPWLFRGDAFLRHGAGESPDVGDTPTRSRAASRPSPERRADCEGGRRVGNRPDEPCRSARRERRPHHSGELRVRGESPQHRLSGSAPRAWRRTAVQPAATGSRPEKRGTRARAGSAVPEAGAKAVATRCTRANQSLVRRKPCSSRAECRRDFANANPPFAESGSQFGWQQPEPDRGPASWGLKQGRGEGAPTGRPGRSRLPCPQRARHKRR